MVLLCPLQEFSIRTLPLQHARPGLHMEHVVLVDIGAWLVVACLWCFIALALSYLLKAGERIKNLGGTPAGPGDARGYSAGQSSEL